MRLSETFLQHVVPASRGHFAACTALDEGLERLLREGTARWPGIRVPPDRYLEFLGRHLPKEAATPAELGALRAADLYLVCAYGLRVPEANEVLETLYMPRVRHLLSRLRVPEPSILDIEQDLRERLVEMATPSVSRRGYSGSGDLVRWMNLCAVREARARLRRARQELAYEDAPVEDLPAGGDPEMELLARLYQEPFQRAFVGALAALSSRERDLLHYRFVSRASIDQIASAYCVHRATAARWVLRAQGRLVEEIRTRFQSQAPMDDDSLYQVVAALQSHLMLSVDLAALLRPAGEPVLS